MCECVCVCVVHDARTHSRTHALAHTRTRAHTQSYTHALPSAITRQHDSLMLGYHERVDIFLLVDDCHDDGADDLLELAEVQVFAVGRLGHVVPERVGLSVGV